MQMIRLLKNLFNYLILTKFKIIILFLIYRKYLGCFIIKFFTSLINFFFVTTKNSFVIFGNNFILNKY